MIGLLLAAVLQSPPMDPARWDLTVTLDKDAYEVGEPILATLRLTNRSAAPALLSRSNEPTGRLDGIELEVRAADGRLVPDPHNSRRVKAFATEWPIEPSRWALWQLHLNDRVPVLAPGRYTVKATFRDRTIPPCSSAEAPALPFQVVPTLPDTVRERVQELRHWVAEGDDGAAVARFLGFTGHPDAIPPLVDLLYGADENTQITAGEGLLYLDRGAAQTTMLQALRERGPRSRMVHLLVVDLQPPGPEVRALLRPWLSDRSPEIRAAAIHGLMLSNIPTVDPKLFSALVEMLHDPSELVRLPAANAVGAYQNADSLRAVKPLVLDPDATVARQATSAVGWVAQAASLPQEVRREAVLVLRRVVESGGAAAEDARYWLERTAAP
jgi:HEAT repeat protein